MYLLLSVTMLMIMWMYLQQPTIQQAPHGVYAWQLSENLSLDCLEVEKAINSGDNADSLHSNLLRYREILKPILSDYAKEDVIYDIKTRTAAENFNRKNLLGVGSSNIVLRIPGCDTWIVKFRVREETISKAESPQEVVSFLQKKGIAAKEKCFHQDDSRHYGRDICVQEMGIDIRHFLLMFPKQRDQLMMPFLIYYARLERYDVKWTDEGVNQLGVYFDYSRSLVAVRLWDTDFLSVGNWRDEEAADFLYYPKRVTVDVSDSVVNLLREVGRS